MANVHSVLPGKPTREVVKVLWSDDAPESKGIIIRQHRPQHVAKRQYLGPDIRHEFVSAQETELYFEAEYVNRVFFLGKRVTGPRW